MSIINMKLAEESVAEENLFARIDLIELQGGEGRAIVPLSKTAPEMQAQFRDFFNKLLASETFKNFLQNGSGNFNIQLKREEKDHFLLFGNETILLEGKAAGKIFQSLLGVKSARLVDSYEQAFHEMVRQKTKPQEGEGNLRASVSEVLAVGADLLSIARNGMSVTAPTALSISAMGVAGGAMTTCSGALMVANGISAVQEAGEIGDLEGAALGHLYTSAGLCLSAVGAGMVVGKAAILNGSPEVAAIAGAGVIDPCLIGMNLLLLGYGSYQLHNAASFRRELHASIEEKSIQGGIEYLYEQLTLSAAEKEKVSALADPKEREAEIVNLLKSKWARFERRTDAASLKTLPAKISRLKKAFDEGAVSKAQLEEAKSLLDTVLHVNYKNMVKSTILILIALAGLAATITSFVISGGTVAILFAVLAGMWLILDKSGVADGFADLFWKIHLRLLDLAGSSLWKSYFEFYEQLQRKEEMLLSVFPPADIDPMKKELSGLATEILSVQSSLNLNEFKTQIPQTLAFLEKFGVYEKKFDAALKLSLEKLRAENREMESLSEEAQLKSAAIFYLQSIYQSALSVQKANLFKNKQSIQEHLSEDIKDKKEIEILGTKIELFEQIIRDYNRISDTYILDEASQERDLFKIKQAGEGERGLLRLKKLAGEDTALFHHLAALYSQTPGNYAVEFLLSESPDYWPYTPNFEREAVYFTKKKDGSFEIEIRMKVEMVDTREDDLRLDLCSYGAVYHLKKSDQGWICENPVYRL